MAKKTLSIIGAALLAASLVACGGGSKGDSTMPAQPAAGADAGTAAAPTPDQTPPAAK